MAESLSRSDQVWAVLRSIVDPDKQEDIVELGYVSQLSVSEAGGVYFHLHLPPVDDGVKEQYQYFAQSAVRELDWVTDVTVILDKGASSDSTEASFSGLAKVKHSIAVSSCKGGVGKSTVALNLAVSLALAGNRVGLFDADIYGPSVPTMVTGDETLAYTEDGLLCPVEAHGLSVMSFGYAMKDLPGDRAAIMRGPMVSQVLNQLLTGTDWGELDYLIIDMPPGTGDVQITLSQMLPLTGVVVVTTPQKVALVDVEKGLDMFKKVNVPILAAVENEQYFVCDSCDKRHEIYGVSSIKGLCEQFDIAQHIALPMDPVLAECGDAGVPMVLRYPDHALSEAFAGLATMLGDALADSEGNGKGLPLLSIVPGQGVVMQYENASPKPMDFYTLRLACECAHCVNEFTGEALLDASTVSKSVEALKIRPIGRYAVGIAWSDGHASVYSYRVLDSLR